MLYLLVYIKSSHFDELVLAKCLILAKLATQGRPKVKVFWNEAYDVIISVQDVINKISLRESNYIADVVMWPKFGSSNISMGKGIITSILFEFDEKPYILSGGLA